MNAPHRGSLLKPGIVAVHRSKEIGIGIELHGFLLMRG